MIAVDRPGYGNSDWVAPGQWQVAAKKYFELIQSQGFKKLSIMGVSGGAPMAHMTASLLGDQVSKLVIVCGLASLSKKSKSTFGAQQRRLLKLAQILPTQVTQKVLDYAMASFQPDKRLSHLLQTLDDSDKRVLSKQEHQETLLKAMKWARNQKSKGIVWDSKIFSSDWLDLYCRTLKTPTIYFHGEKDYLLKPEMSEWMSSKRPNTRLQLIPDQGHYSIAFESQDEILTEIESLKSH